VATVHLRDTNHLRRAYSLAFRRRAYPSPEAAITAPTQGRLRNQMLWRALATSNHEPYALNPEP